MSRDQDIVYEQALDIVAARMLRASITTMNQLLEAVRQLQVRRKGRRNSHERTSDRDLETRIAAARRLEFTRLRDLSDVATGRKRDSLDELL